MDLIQYQSEARATAVYPEQDSFIGLMYAALGLCGEAGELAGLIKKAMRDDDMILTMSRREKAIEELGDILWYVSAVADELDVTLGSVASQNLTKLQQRKLENKLHGR